MLAVTGLRTTIVTDVLALMGGDHQRIGDYDPGPVPGCFRYLLAAGVLPGKAVKDQSEREMFEAAWVNLLRPMRLCEAILEAQPEARICVVGSLSGLQGSFDKTYSATKAGLHSYVLHRTTGRGQQLFCVAPGIISDAGMTVRRPDYPGILESRKTVKTLQVARVIVRHLWDPDPNWLTNAIVEVT